MSLTLAELSTFILNFLNRLSVATKKPLLLRLSSIVCIWTALFWSICYWSQEEHPISRYLTWKWEAFTFAVTVTKNISPRSAVAKQPMRHRGPNAARGIIARLPFAKTRVKTARNRYKRTSFRPFLSLYALVRLYKASTQNYRLIHGQHLFAYWIPCNFQTTSL